MTDTVAIPKTMATETTSSAYMLPTSKKLYKPNNFESAESKEIESNQSNEFKSSKSDIVTME